MCQTGRLFNCIRCHEQVIICSRCDHGQIYCTNGCSKVARQESTRAADARYQKTLKGKHNHAKRQQRYRQEKKQSQIKVTDQGSLTHSLHDVISSDTVNEKNSTTESTTHELHCHFCNEPVSTFLRNRFLLPTERYRAVSMQ